MLADAHRWGIGRLSCGPVADMGLHLTRTVPHAKKDRPSRGCVKGVDKNVGVDEFPRFSTHAVDRASGCAGLLCQANGLSA
jgi:hypothetical protein